MHDKKKKRILFIIIAILLVIAAIACSATWYFNIGRFNGDPYKHTSSSQSGTPTDSDVSSNVVKVENPIDFDKLEKENSDIYAWITVPNTKIDYPIVQSFTENDLYYIDHTVKKKYSAAGSIFTQKRNQRDFSDPNTVIYGHNMRNGTMFRHLHKFKEKEFFDENEYFYIYIRGHILTYRIFSAYEYDNRHILNSFDFSDKQVLAEYLRSAANPSTMIKNTREVPLTTDDRIVTLSTCMANNKPESRYLVQGVLIKDEPTY